MVAFSGAAYNSAISVSTVADHPSDIGATWLAGRASESFNVDDGAMIVQSPGMVNSPRLTVSSEGALEWYAGWTPKVGQEGVNAVNLPGISRMYLPGVEFGYAYTLVFHLLNTDCGTKNTFVAGGVDAATIVNGGIARYNESAATLFVAARVSLDGSLEVYIRPTQADQEIRLFERRSSEVLQNTLLATAQVGQTQRLLFLPSSTFSPYEPPRALVAGQMQSVFSSPLQPFQVRSSTALQTSINVELGGLGEFPFKVEGLSGSQKARVTLLRARDKMVAAQVWSAADGTGIFTGLDMATKFIALAEAPDGSMHPVAAAHYPRLPGGA